MHSGRKCDFISLVATICFCMLLLSSISSCTSPGSLVPSRLDVTRVSPLRSLPELHTIVTNAKAVQQLYQAAYKLPDPPTGKRNCLDDTGVVYHLTFIQDTQNTEEMNMQVSGCLTLTTVQGDYQEDDQFLDLAKKVIHVNPLVPPYPGSK